MKFAKAKIGETTTYWYRKNGTTYSIQRDPANRNQWVAKVRNGIDVDWKLFKSKKECESWLTLTSQ